MRLALFALAAAVGGFTAPAPALAHPGGHDAQHRPEPRPIAQIAQESVVKLVTQAKLPASWSKARVLKSEQRTRAGARIWVVTFQNLAERNPAKRMLYVVMSTNGTFISANHRPT